MKTEPTEPLDDFDDFDDDPIVQDGLRESDIVDDDGNGLFGPPGAKIRRFYRSEIVAEEDPENPEGLVLNTGEILPLGDAKFEAEAAADEPFSDLLRRYQECECDKLRSDSWHTMGLLKFPGCYIVFRPSGRKSCHVTRSMASRNCPTRRWRPAPCL